MTMFQFMANAFYALVGAACVLLLAALIMGAVLGMIRAIKKERDGEHGDDSH